MFLREFYCVVFVFSPKHSILVLKFASCKPQHVEITGGWNDFKLVTSAHFFFHVKGWKTAPGFACLALHAVFLYLGLFICEDWFCKLPVDLEWWKAGDTKKKHSALAKCFPNTCLKIFFSCPNPDFSRHESIPMTLERVLGVANYICSAWFIRHPSRPESKMCPQDYDSCSHHSWVSAGV